MLLTLHIQKSLHIIQTHMYYGHAGSAGTEPGAVRESGSKWSRRLEEGLRNTPLPSKVQYSSLPPQVQYSPLPPQVQYSPLPPQV